MRGSVSAALARLPLPRGEFTVVLAGAQKAQPAVVSPPGSEQLLGEFYQLTKNGQLSRREAISSLAGRYGMPSRELYRLVEAAKEEVE